eukprot:gnl/TRDRNA2_/TRDRNA2_134154_c0_seq1.p2 gnl/TRDRNA2_/TRDRNA2_134154_c0~~gnl/TRDRNA2_/TRDRNA2_134154_c0_seq1.p2  ORF type:complete len:102 (-),score=21.67 gnl/TRDRNA2_/TRDRNA2_134154_c0_seq1:89-394(-)
MAAMATIFHSLLTKEFWFGGGLKETIRTSVMGDDLYTEEDMQEYRQSNEARMSTGGSAAQAEKRMSARLSQRASQTGMTPGPANVGKAAGDADDLADFDAP